MRLILGDGFEIIEQLKPRFIVTDCNIELIGKLIRWCETHDAICIDAYSTRWLTCTGEHPAEKRVEPYKALIEAFPNEPLVVDPFMGSGAIGEAALRAGRDFIGIEKVDRWFTIAEKRLNGIANALAGQDRAVG